MRKIKQPAAIFLGVVASFFFLWVAFRGISFGTVYRHLREADPILLGLAIVNHTLGIHCRAIRWKYLLLPVTRRDVAFRARLSSTAIGIAANNLIPLRVGEFARVLVLARQTHIAISVVMGTLVMERLLDGIVMVATIFGVMALPSFPDISGMDGMNPAATARSLLSIAAGVGVILGLFALFPSRSVKLARRAITILPKNWRRPLVDSLRSFLRGLGVLRSPKYLALSLLGAVGQWTFLGLGFYLGFLAFGIGGVGFSGAMFFQALIGFAVAIPSSPGFFGPWEAASRYALGFWGVDEASAVSFAVAFHAGTYILMTAIGVFYLWKLGLRWKDVLRSAEAVEVAVEREPEVVK